MEENGKSEISERKDLSECELRIVRSLEKIELPLWFIKFYAADISRFRRPDSQPNHYLKWTDFKTGRSVLGVETSSPDTLGESQLDQDQLEACIKLIENEISDEDSESQSDQIKNNEVEEDSISNKSDKWVKNGKTNEIMASSPDFLKIVRIEEGSTQPAPVHFECANCKKSSLSKFCVSCRDCFVIYCGRGCRKRHLSQHKALCTCQKMRLVLQLVVQHSQLNPTVNRKLSELAKERYRAMGRGHLSVVLENTRKGIKYLRGDPQMVIRNFKVRYAFFDNEMFNVCAGNTPERAAINLCNSYDPAKEMVLNVLMLTHGKSFQAKGSQSLLYNQFLSQAAKIEMS